MPRSVQNSTGGTNRTSAAALAYPLGAASALFCLWRFADDRFVRFHAWQSLLLCVALAAAILALSLVPLLGLVLVYCLALGGFFLIAFLMWKAYRGHWLRLPLLGDIALERVLRSD